MKTRVNCKKGDAEDPGNYRGITLLKCGRKAVARF